MNRTVITAGADACRLSKKKKGWAIVELEDGAFRDADFTPTLAAYLEQFTGDLVAVDIPIGLPDKGKRRADGEAKKFVGSRHSSVFYTLTRKALEAPDIMAARRVQKVSPFAYALRSKILEVDELLDAAEREKIIEFHPEVSFCALCNRYLDSKKTWNGQAQRRRILNHMGVELPPELPADAGRVPPDDLFDAAAGALTAQAVIRETAEFLPAEEEGDRSKRGVIWYPAA